jgi:hypothetical protein
MEERMTKENARRGSLLKMLESNNPNKRYDACEQLRVTASIPEDALVALSRATQDSNPDVADAAKRAVALHTNAPLTQDNAPIAPEESAWKHSRFGMMSLSSALLAAVCYSALVVTSSAGYRDFVLLPVLGILCFPFALGAIICGTIGISKDREKGFSIIGFSIIIFMIIRSFSCGAGDPMCFTP